MDLNLVAGENDLMNDLEEEEEDDEFHCKFIAELKKKEQLERIQNSKGVNFEEDEDDFMQEIRG